MFTNPDDTQISSLLKNSTTIAVVGISGNPERDSYKVAEYLQKQGYKIIPINPAVKEVLGEKAYSSLTQVSIKNHYDRIIVNTILNFFTAFKACGWLAGMMTISPSFI